MKELPDLKKLTEEAKDALILELWEKVQKLEQQAEKTWKNSSLPPAQGFEAEVKSEEQSIKAQRVGSIGREGGGRELSQNRTKSSKQL
jgi:transposase